MKSVSAVVTFLILLVFSPSAQASIVYNVNHAIGAGSINGFVQTNGTLGVLSSADIINWNLNLSAPNLVGGPNVNINFGNQTQTLLSGATTTATPTSLIFDMSGGSGIGFFLLQGGIASSSDFWILETALAGWTGSGVGEHIGFNTDGTTVAQTTIHPGNFVFGTSVPEPGHAVLLGISVISALIFRRRR